MLREYAEFNKFMKRSISILQEREDDSNSNYNQIEKDEEAIRTLISIGDELEVTYNELKASIAVRDESTTIRNIKRSLKLLEELHQLLENIRLDEITGLLFALGLPYTYSILERLLHKAVKGFLFIWIIKCISVP